MGYRFANRRKPDPAALTDVERAQATQVASRVFGDELSVDEVCDTCEIWQALDGDGRHVYDLWADSPTLWMDCALFVARTEELAPIVMIQHGFQALDPAFEHVAEALAEAPRG